MNMNWIEEAVLAGGEIPINLGEIRALKAQGFRAIVTLTEYELTWLDTLKDVPFGVLGFELLHVPMLDMHPPTKEQVAQVFAFLNRMRQAQKPVYLHCEVGMGRTGTMLHALALMDGMTLDEAKRKIETARPLSRFNELTKRQQAFLQRLAKDLDV